MKDVASRVQLWCVVYNTVMILVRACRRREVLEAPRARCVNRVPCGDRLVVHGRAARREALCPACTNTISRIHLSSLIKEMPKKKAEGGGAGGGGGAEKKAKTASSVPAAKAAKAANKKTSVQAASSTSGGMPPEFGKGKEKDDAETAAKTAATMPRKGGPGYLQLVLDALDTLGTASLPKIKNWFASERPEVDFKPHLLKAALKKGIEKGAPPQARVCRSSRAAHLTSLFFPQAPSCRTRPPTRFRLSAERTGICARTGAG